MTNDPRENWMGASRGGACGCAAAAGAGVALAGPLLFFVGYAGAGAVALLGGLLLTAGVALIVGLSVRACVNWWLMRRRAPEEAGPAPMLAFAGLAAVVAAAGVIVWLLLTGAE